MEDEHQRIAKPSVQYVTHRLSFLSLLTIGCSKTHIRSQQSGQLQAAISLSCEGRIHPKVPESADQRTSIRGMLSC